MGHSLKSQKAIHLSQEPDVMSEN